MPAEKLARKQVERREEAETKILNAAIRLIVERGYDRFTIAEVGETAGYSRGLPAHYFGKKEDLLAEVVRYIIDNYRTGMSKLEAAEPGLPHLAARIRNYVEGAGSRASRALGILLAEAMVRPKLKRLILDLNARGRQVWEDEIRAGIEGGNIRPEVNVVGEAAIIFAFLRGQAGFAALDPKFDVAGVTEHFLAGMIERLATERGRKLLAVAKRQSNLLDE